MEDFARLFGGLLTFTYHCFDRIVIRGHLPLLIRPENIVHFFRDVHGVAPITRRSCASAVATTSSGWRTSRASCKIPRRVGQKRRAQGRLCAPLAAADGAPRALGCILSSRAWNSVLPLGGTQVPPIPTTAFWPVSARATAITTSTCATRYWDPWRCAWGCFCLSRSPTISTAITSSKTSCTTFRRGAVPQKRQRLPVGG